MTTETNTRLPCWSYIEAWTKPFIYWCLYMHSYLRDSHCTAPICCVGIKAAWSSQGEGICLPYPYSFYHHRNHWEIQRQQGSDGNHIVLVIPKDTVATDEKDNEVDADNHSRRGWTSVGHDAIIHHRIPVFTCQDLRRQGWGQTAGRSLRPQLLCQSS